MTVLILSKIGVPMDATLSTLLALPPNHAFWHNGWMFTRPVVMQESQQGNDPAAFWRWVKSQPKPLQTYINNPPAA
jgi:hypothetical protein